MSNNLFEGLEAVEGSAFADTTTSERMDAVNELIETTFEELRDNEVKEVTSVENAINDYTF